MRYCFGLLVIMLFACSVAVLIVYGVAVSQHSISRAIDDYNPPQNQQSFVVPPVHKTSPPIHKAPPAIPQPQTPTPKELPQADSHAQFNTMIDRRTTIANQILGEITSKVMPDAVGYEVCGNPQGFEVSLGTSVRIDQILMDYLYDPDPEVRAAAIMCLQWYIDELPQLSVHIWPATADSDEEVRYCARSLMDRAQLSLVDTAGVIGMLDNDDDSAKGYALNAMLNWGEQDNHDPELDKTQLLVAVPRLFELMDDSNPHIRQGAAKVLSFLGPLIPDLLAQTLGLFNSKNLEHEKLATSILHGMGPQAISAVPHLVKRLEPNPRDRLDGFLFQVLVARAILEIEPGLADKVALKIAKNLGLAHSKGYREALLLHDMGADARVAIPILKSYQVGEINQTYLHASQALAGIAPDDPEVITKLTEIYAVVQSNNKFWVLEGLANATDNYHLALPTLTLALEDESENVRNFVEKILDKKNHTEAEPTLDTA